jgi:hypothetical protein
LSRTQFVDARKMSKLAEGSRTRRRLSAAEIERIGQAFKIFDAGTLSDEKGCRVAAADMTKPDYILTLGR